MPRFLLLFFFALLARLPAGQSKTLVEPSRCTESKNDGGVCEKEGMSGVCFGEECFIASPSERKFIVKVRYPANNPHFIASQPNPTTLWLRGNGLGLTWNKGKQMKKSTETDTWEHLLEFTIHSALWSTHTTNKDPLGRFEFRVYLEDRVDMLGANFILPLPPSTNTVDTSDDVPSIWFYPWFYSKTGTLIENRRIYSPDLKQTRNITVYKPASFTENTYKKYETLFVNDGQRLKFMVTQVDNLAVTQSLLKEVLLIGVVNDFVERTHLLAPSNGSDVMCKVGNHSNMCNDCLLCISADSRCSYQKLIADYRRCYRWVPIPSIQGQRYLDFIQNTLIPDSQSTYRASPGAANVGIMGFSFGGLVACHAIWTRPQTFGSAACMSPSLWWPFPENATFPGDAQYEFVTSTLREHRGVRPRQKVYIDVGSNEGYIMVAPARNASRILANTSYFEMNENLWFYEWDEQDHNYKRVLERVWAPLLALYGAEASPNPNAVTNMASPQTQRHVYIFFILGIFLVFLGNL